MELSERLIQVKSSAKLERDFVFTQEDVVFFFGDLIRPVGQILSYKDPSECYELLWGVPCSWAYTSPHLACLQ